MDILEENKFVYIDFEFNRSDERNLTLVSCSYQVQNLPVKNVWLLDEDKHQNDLYDHFTELNSKKYIFVAYAATAESRCFLSLGLDPNEFKWIDLYFEHLQLIHTYNKFKYGKYFKDTGILRRSIPPYFDPKRNIGKDNNKVGRGYKDAVAVHFGEYIDSDYKDAMRNLILECKPSYTEKEKTDIMEYCASDIKWLPKLLANMNRECALASKVSPGKMLKVQQLRGDFAASLSKMEQEGFPVEVDSIKNLRRNFPNVRELLITNLNKIYPFFQQEKIRKSDFKGIYKRKTDKLKEFIENHPQIDAKKWPITDKGAYKGDEKTLDKYLGYPEIKALKETNKAISQLEWFQLPKKLKDSDFFDNVGPDDRLRAFLGGFGTKTGRNAPRAKTFILAMSNWLRCLIKPPEGQAIVAIDYAQQEFIIAAIMSQDKQMIAAYASGDPYLYFAKQAGAVPKDGTRKEYSEIRDLFKNTILGLQYGMGAESMGIKLTADCGRYVPMEEAAKLIQLHRKTYPVYWRWLDTKDYEYKRNKCLVLKDGWALLPNEDNGLSVKNFSVQGTGGTIMRRAVYLAHRKGIRILAPLHDAIYAIYDVKTQKDHPEILSKCMQQAAEDVLGKGIEIRQDIDIHDHSHTWVEGKGKEFYKMLNKYLEKMETGEDIDEELDNGLFLKPKEMIYAINK